MKHDVITLFHDKILSLANGDNVSVVPADVYRVLGPDEDELPHFDPGTVAVLSVSGTRGFCNAIHFIADDAIDGVQTTEAEIDNSIRDMIRLASRWCGQYYGRDINGLIDHGLFGVKKCGGSAGLAYTAAMLSACSGKTLSSCAFTGELDIRGNVKPVGGIPQKLLAAFSSGIEHVYLPERNYSQIDINEYPFVQLHPVANLEQLAKELGISSDLIASR